MNSKGARLTLLSSGLLILMGGIFANYLMGKTLNGLTATKKPYESVDWYVDMKVHLAK